MTKTAEPKTGPGSIVAVTIPANEYFSDIAAFGSNVAPVMLTMPDGWEPAVVLTFQLSMDGTAFYDAMNADGTPMSSVVHPGTAVVFQTVLKWAPYARLRSGTYESPVPQTADRTFQFILA